MKSTFGKFAIDACGSTVHWYVGSFQDGVTDPSRDANSLAIFIPRGFGELGIAFFHSSGIRGSKTYSSGGPRVTYYQIYPNLIKFQV